MTGTEICPKCGTHFDGVWWQNAETENVQLREQLAEAVEALERAHTQANGNITGCGTCATIRVELGIALAKIREGK